MTRKRIISILVTISIIVVALLPFTISAATVPKLNATSKAIYVGDSYTVKVTGSNITSKSFASSNKKVATVTSKGVVKAVKKGSATITATVKYKSGSKTLTKKLTCKITVKAFVTPTASPTSKTIYVGNTFTMSKSGSNITSVTYTTSNKKVATVTTNGVVKGIKVGTATITATIKYNQNGSVKTKKVTCKVTVKAKPTTTTQPTTKPTTKPTTTTTTQPVTDKDGYNNQILKP